MIWFTPSAGDSGPWPLLLHGGLSMSAIMFVLWGRQARTRFANAVDAAWAYGFSLMALIAVVAGLQGAFKERILLVALMLVFWSLRLGTHLLRQRVLGVREEDTRYKALRGQWSQGKFFVFYQMQAALVVLFSVPVYIAMTEPSAQLRAWDLLGLGVWLVAWLGETIADAQLAAHKKDPANKGRTCRRGLWAWSRHPNYFFEWLHWFAYVCVGFAAPLGWLTLLGPVLMLFFLFKVTGIRPSEAQSLKNRPDYADYVSTTNMFFPWFPKRSAGK
jgi:steroid 5-alpha reductase family enzyme